MLMSAVRILAELCRHSMGERFLEYPLLVEDMDRKSLLTVLSRNVGLLVKQEEKFLTVSQ